MAKSFFETQAAERKKMWLMTALIFLVYFGAFFVLTFAVASIVEPTMRKALLRSIPTAGILAVAVLGIQLWFADRHGMRVILEGLSAKPPDSEDHYHQRLVRLTEEIGVAAGGIRVKPVVVPTLAANAFALADREHAVIGVTEGAVSWLSREQTQALVAHEMAHVVNRDCRLATWICAMAAPFVALADVLEKLEEDENGFRDQAAGTAVRTIVSLLTCALSRKRELLADAKAIELTRNPLAMAEAIHRVSTGNHFVVGTAGSLAPIFIVPSHMRPVDEREGLFADFFSSHPPTRRRLDTLLEMAGIGREQLEKGLEVRPQAAPVESLDNQLADRQRWELRVGEKWVGPFPLADLTGLAGFGTQSWVRRAGAGDEGTPAFTDPLINRHFRQARTEPPTAGLCPRCNAPVEKVIYEGLPIGKCRSCGGCLVAEMRVPRLLKRREIGFSDEFLREVDAWLEENSVARRAPGSLETGEDDAPCTCPLCEKPMFRRYYSYQYFIPVDRCLDCHQIWFDGRELELLQALVERRADSNARPPMLEFNG